MSGEVFRFGKEFLGRERSKCIGKPIGTDGEANCLPIDGDTKEQSMSELDPFRSVRNNTEMSDALARLSQELAQAPLSQNLDAETESRAQHYLQEAIREVNMPVPSKGALLDAIDSARACLSGQAASASIAEALKRASDTVQRLF